MGGVCGQLMRREELPFADNPIRIQPDHIRALRVLRPNTLGSSPSCCLRAFALSVNVRWFLPTMTALPLMSLCKVLSISRVRNA